MNKNAHGFGLLEVLIAVALLGAVALGVMQVSKIMSKSTVKYNMDNDVLNITRELVTILGNPINCRDTFQTLDPNGGTVSSIMQNTQPRYPVNGDFGNAHFTIGSYTLSAADSDVSLASNTTKLVIRYTRKKVESGPSEVVKKIKLHVDLDASNRIVSCRALSGGAGEIWQRGSGTEIYYAAGNVAVGHNDPVAALDVAGEIKFGNTSSPCDSATEGQQRYNSTSKLMEYCNGTIWKTPGGTIVKRNCTSHTVSTNGSTCAAGKMVTQIYSNGGDWGGGDTFECCEVAIE